MKTWQANTCTAKVPNAPLAQYFEAREVDLGVDFGDLSETQVEPIFEAFTALPEQEQASMEVDFQDINALANDGGINALRNEAAFYEDATFPEAISAIEDWHSGAISADTLAAFARALMQRREVDQGKRPEHYTEQATCKHCGPIWLWFAGEVLGCPWCWNRVADKPIPRPSSVHYGDCIHFERIDHPHLCHCAKGEPEGIAGLWNTDQRYCERFLPLPQQTDNDQPRPTRAETKSKFPK